MTRQEVTDTEIRRRPIEEKCRTASEEYGAKGGVERGREGEGGRWEDIDEERLEVNRRNGMGKT